MINRKLLILGLVGGLLLGLTFPENTNILTRLKFKIRYKQVHKQIKNSKLFYDCFLFSGTARANENQTFSDSVKIFSGHVEDIDGVKPLSGVVMVRDVQSDSTYSSYLDTLARFYIEIIKTPTGVKDIDVSVPSGYVLTPLYPNPNDGSSSPSFNWTLVADSDVNVSVYNVLGQKVKEIASGELRAGNYRGFWDGTNEAGVKVAEGVYFVNIHGSTSKGKDLNLTEKCLLLDQISGSGTGYTFGGFAYDPETGLFKANSGSDYELSAEIPGRFLLTKNYSGGDNTEGLSLVTDRKASFVTGFSDTLYVVEGGTVYKIAIPSVDNDDSDHSFSVKGDYASIVGDSILIAPPKDANGSSVLELIAKENGVRVDSVSADLSFFMGNYAPVISGDFPADTLYVMQGVSDLDSIAAIPLRSGIHDRFVNIDFATDANNDPLVWTAESSDTSKINAFVQDGVLYVAGKDTTGYGTVNVRVTDPKGEFDERNLAVLVFGKDRTYEEGGKTNYYVPWSHVLDVNRINSVEQFLIDEGYQEESLNRNIIYGRWKEMKYLRDVTFTKGWANENNFEGWSWESQKMLIDYTLDELIYNNVTFLRVRIPFFMRDSTDTEIIEIYDGRLDVSLRDFELKYLINQSHNKGLGISIVPIYSDLNSFPFGNLAPVSWEGWFSNYGNYLQNIALIAQETGLDILHVGEGFINVSGTISDDEWGNLFRAQIQRSRRVYPGPETYLDHNYYSWMFGQWDKIKIWKDVDIVGGGPLWGSNNEITTSLDPTFDEIYDYFKNHINTHIQNLYNLTRRPIIFLENGIVSGDGVFKNFMNYIGGYSFHVDMTEQELYYKVVFEVMKDLTKDWFFGQGYYGLSFVPAAGGVNDVSIDPRGKPAEDVMRFYYGNGDTKSRIIQIDGKFDDWKPEFLLATDSLGDSKTSAYDLKAVYGVRDDMYVYLMVEFEGRLRNIPQKDIIGLDFDLNQDNNKDIPLGILLNPDKWMGIMNDDMTYSTLRSISLIGYDTSFSHFEIKIPLRLLDYSRYISLPRVSVGDLIEGVENDFINEPVIIP